MISAHNLPKTRDERCVPQAWDEFESPCDFAQLPLTTADVASPMCEVCRRVPALEWLLCRIGIPIPVLECLLWACNVREGRARPLDMSHTTPEVERLRLTLPGDPPSSSCFYHVSWLSPQVELLGGRVGPGTQWSVMGGVAPPWEEARQLVITLGIAVDPLVITP